MRILKRDIIGVLVVVSVFGALAIGLPRLRRVVYVNSLREPIPFSEYVIPNQDDTTASVLQVAKVLNPSEAIAKQSNGAFRDLAVLGDWIVAATPTALVRFHRSTGVGDVVAIRGFEATRIPEPSFETIKVVRNAMWLYDFAGQKLVRLDVSNAHRPVSEVIDVPPQLSDIVTNAHRLWATNFDRTSLSSYELSSVTRLQDSESALSIKMLSAADGRVFPHAATAIGIRLNRNALAHSDGVDRFALAYRFLSRIQIYDARGLLERSIAGPVEVPLSFQIHAAAGAPDMVPDSETRFAFLDAVGHRDYLVTLFSGRRIREGKKMVRVAANYIQVFGWDGRHLGTWTLSKPVHRIEMDSTGTIYGLAADDPLTVYQFATDMLIRSLSTPIVH